jgi:acyl-CoA synthetase (AMP-forming)/AMP-acid ligase II
MQHRTALLDNLIRRANVGDILLRAAERHPRKEAVIDGARRYTYAALNDWTNQVAHGLLARGFGPGDRLALMSGNRVEFLVTYFACAKLGIALVPINLLWGVGETRYVLSHARCRAVVVEAEHLPRLHEAAPDTGEFLVLVMDGGGADSFDALATARSTSEPECLVPNDAAVSILYTSGTTSAPKGVVASHLGIVMESLGTALETRMTDADRITVMLPLFHTAQLNALCTPAVAAGAAMVVVRGFDAPTVLDLVEQERISVLFALPMMIRALCEEQARKPRRVDSLRLCVYAMAAMPRGDLLRAMDLLGCDFSLMFGQTEMGPVSTFFRPEHQLSHEGAVGTQTVNVRVGIMDPEGRLLPPGETGEIVYRSPQVLTSYLDNPQATAEVFAHGWFHSGDAGHFDEDGMLWFDDRFKDVIKSGGENVSSIEVEKALLEADPGIAEVAVIGLPHARWTEAITAFIVPAPGAQVDLERLSESLRHRLSSFKCPKDIVMQKALPKTATGKVQKAQLRKMHVKHYDGGQ